MSLLPSRIYASVCVPDTPLVSAALSLAQSYLPPPLFNHSMRAFLFGFIIADKLPALHSRDREAHAIAAILHDLGLAAAGDFLSADRRFEVDGADGARAFLKREGRSEEWDLRRIQLVWDAIALHTTDSIAWYKEPEVVAMLHGVNADFGTPDFEAVGALLTRVEYNAVLDEVPRLGMKEGVRDAFCRLCNEKPETTYDNLVGRFGEKYVQNYRFQGMRSLDFVEADTLEERD